MPTFNDSDNIEFNVADGDYAFTVIEFEQGISTGGKTAGSTMYKIKLEIALPTPGKRGPHVYDNLIDHPSCGWKIDTLLKCCGVVITRGQSFEFDASAAERAGVPHVDLFGLRGWCRLGQDEYNGKKKNVVACYYTDKQKLPRNPHVTAPVPHDFRSTPKKPTAQSSSPIDDTDVPF